jgi:hypothetical protein
MMLMTIIIIIGESDSRPLLHFLHGPLGVRHVLLSLKSLFLDCCTREDAPGLVPA